MPRAARSRIRQHLDMRRLGLAVSYPGIDPRSWVSFGRVDDDDDAVRWDAERGWIVDVTMLGGGIDGEGPIACRVTGSFVSDGGARVEPVTRKQLVLVAIPEGSLNVNPTIVGVISTPDLPPPASVNGQDIDEDFAKANHVLVTPHSVQQEVGERWRTSATSRATLEAPEVRLADEDADQSFVRGNDQLDALGDVLDALDAYLNSVQSIMTATPFPKPGLSVAYTAWQASLQAARASLQNALSTKIKGS